MDTSAINANQSGLKRDYGNMYLSDLIDPFDASTTFPAHLHGSCPPYAANLLGYPFNADSLAALAGMPPNCGLEVMAGSVSGNMADFGTVNPLYILGVQKFDMNGNFTQEWMQAELGIIPGTLMHSGISLAGGFYPHPADAATISDLGTSQSPPIDTLSFTGPPTATPPLTMSPSEKTSSLDDAPNASFRSSGTHRQSTASPLSTASWGQVEKMIADRSNGSGEGGSGGMSLEMQRMTAEATQPEAGPSKSIRKVSEAKASQKKELLSSPPPPKRQKKNLLRKGPPPTTQKGLKNLPSPDPHSIFHVEEPAAPFTFRELGLAPPPDIVTAINKDDLLMDEDEAKGGSKKFKGKRREMNRVAAKRHREKNKEKMRNLEIRRIWLDQALATYEQTNKKLEDALKRMEQENQALKAASTGT